MHVHGSFSEGMGSMEWHTAQAAALGLDAIWWTDHDWRVAHWQHTERFDFETATWDTANLRVVEPDDAYPFQFRRWHVGPTPEVAVVDTLAYEGSRAMRLEFDDRWNWPSVLWASLDQVSSRFHNMYHLGVRVRLQFAADSLRAEDNSMDEVSLLLGVRNSARVVAFFDDYRIVTDDPTGEDMMNKTREIGAHYEIVWSGVRHFVGTEVSRWKSQPHLNGFGPNLQLVDYTGTDWPDSIH
jgi:hypothetical protein